MVREVKLDAGCPPFADFAVFRPYGNRWAKKLSFMRTFVDSTGAHKREELHGPSSPAEWCKHFKPYQTALVMHKVLSVGTIQRYRSTVLELAGQYPGHWFLIVQAEHFARSERLEVIVREAERATASGRRPLGFDSDRPWEYAFRQLCDPDHPHWRRYVRSWGWVAARPLRLA